MNYTSSALDSSFMRQMSPEFFWGLLLVFALGGVLLVQYQYSNIQRAQLVKAIVVEMQQEVFGAGSAVFATYKILEGPYIGVVCSSTISSNPPLVSVGEICDVYYDPAKGVVFSLKGEKYLMAISVGITVFGLVIFWVMGKGMLNAGA